MAKAPKRAFVCNECGADYPRWQGQCSACHAWNTITEVRGVAASPSVARNERLSGYAGNAGFGGIYPCAQIHARVGAAGACAADNIVEPYAQRRPLLYGFPCGVDIAQ